MPVVSMKQLLEAGVHFGHQTRRWNPKMKPFIFTERNGIYIIDLQKTLGMLEAAYKFVRETAAAGEQILFVGTKKQAQEAIKEEAEKAGMPYVNYRWLGGMLTNYRTIRSRIERLDAIDRMFEDGSIENLPKKEVLKIQGEREKLLRNLGGIRNMDRLPGAVYIVDPRKEQIAIREARRLGIPIVAIVDTNCDPDEVEYVIPGNDDAIRAVTLITRIMADAALEGREIRSAQEAAAAEEEAEKVGAAAEKAEIAKAEVEAEKAASETAEKPAEVEPEGGEKPTAAKKAHPEGEGAVPGGAVAEGEVAEGEKESPEMKDVGEKKSAGKTKSGDSDEPAPDEEKSDGVEEQGD